MMSWRQPARSATFAGSSARFACRPVLYIAMNTQGSMAITTSIIMRFRSSASRTCEAPRVTEGGVMEEGVRRLVERVEARERLARLEVPARLLQESREGRHQDSFSMRESMSRSSGP